MPRVNKRNAQELVRCKDLTTKHFPHGLQTVELSCRYEADWCLKCIALDLGQPSKLRKTSMTSKAKLKIKAPKKRFRLLVGASPTKVICPREHIFGTQTYSSVPQAEHKLMIWHIHNCNIIVRTLQVTENSQNNEGGYWQVFLWKCCSGRKGVSKLNTARQNHARTPYARPLPRVYAIFLFAIE